MLAKDWNDPDQEASGPRAFQPAREPGAHFPDRFRPVQEASFFYLFFTPAVVAAITAFTNEYAWMHIAEKKTYGDKFGAWIETNCNEIYRLLELIIFMSLNKLPRLKDYYKITSLLHGNWARAIIPTFLRYKALMAFSTCTSSR